MDGGTLDFNDLMDTGDDFPGFEIAKFTPANDSADNDDGVLRTPEHEQGDDDYVLRETKHDKDDQLNTSNLAGVEEGETNTNDEVPFNIQDSCDAMGRQSNVADDLGDDLDIHDDGHGADHVTGEEDSADVVEVDQQGEHSGQGDSVEEGDNSNQEKHQDENTEEKLTPKRKKTFQQKRKALMQLWSRKAKKDDSTENTSERGHSEHDIAGQDDFEALENGDSGECKEEESPQQQSFLSFLNLKPGHSKPKEQEDLQKEESLQEEFYSRKRLRTRKKVSYCEDVQQDDDDSYNEEEDAEFEDDHKIDLTRGNRSKSLNNSRSPGKNSAVTNYAKALQNLLPGVDLSCLQQAKTSPAGNKLQTVNLGASNANLANLKGLFECGICGTFFQTANQFLTHQNTVHVGHPRNGKSGMETFRCEVCGFVLTNRFAYLEHKKMKHSKASGISFNCNKCKMSRFPDITALQKHQQVCGTPFCSTCGATFQAWVDVAEHRKQMHASTVPTRQWLTCSSTACNFKCITQHEMKQHVQVKHMLNELFSCNVPKCARVFSTRELLTEHKKEVHASEFIVQYQCMECKNCFSSKTLLAEHQYLHTLEKLRKCDLCLRTFGCVSELRKHKDVHTVKGNIRCQACLRWCVDQIELVNHVCSQRKRNSGIRLYFCDVCHKDFRSDEKMFAHRKDHKNFFQCALCFLEFSSESEYFEHRQVHGKYTCKECCEELEKEEMEMHEKAHKYYIKMEDIENDGKNELVMFLCPNLFNAIKA